MNYTIVHNGHTFNLAATSVWAFLLVVLWSYVWKGLALWRAGRQGDKVWFVVLLLLNTLGILEIAYLFYFSKHSKPATSDNE